MVGIDISYTLQYSEWGLSTISNNDEHGKTIIIISK